MTSISLPAPELEIFESSKVLCNHICSSLSELDLEMIQSIPEGGNWQDIPAKVVKKSKRLMQIQQSGGRTTYYGRLKSSLPSYTINTYFNRPGNGTFVHPRQNRLISFREAARLQSFPDRFRFLGSNSSKFKQIGNAVPPLLARAVALHIKPGRVVDLFSGAGGLSEGFVQAGHDLILAVDSNPNMCKTYAYNHPTAEVLRANLLDSRQSKELHETIEQSLAGKHMNSLIGGPPCQGFSTAGNRNSMDSRNTLVFQMIELIERFQPDNVVIENVLGLKWMKRGQVLESIKNLLEKMSYSVSIFDLKSEEYGVPQRRRRIFVVGTMNGECQEPPHGLLSPIVRGKNRKEVRLESEFLPPPVTVDEAISDLPPITSGGGQDLQDYDPTWIVSEYQRLMRDGLSFEDFISQRTKQG